MKKSFQSVSLCGSIDAQQTHLYSEGLFTIFDIPFSSSYGAQPCNYLLEWQLFLQFGGMDATLQQVEISTAGNIEQTDVWIFNTIVNPSPMATAFIASGTNSLNCQPATGLIFRVYGNVVVNGSNGGTSFLLQAQQTFEIDPSDPMYIFPGSGYRLTMQ